MLVSLRGSHLPARVLSLWRRLSVLPGVAFPFGKPRSLGTKRGYLGAERGGPEAKDKPRLEQANPLQASSCGEKMLQSGFAKRITRVKTPNVY